MSRKTRKDDSVDVDPDSLPWWRRPGRGAALSLLTLVLMLVVAVGGLERLKAGVESLPEYNPTPKLELMDAPAWVEQENWRPQILSCIKLADKPNWLDGGLVRDVGRQLSESGWVSQVKRVTQDIDGTVRIWCDYRRPIAMVRTDRSGDGYFYVAVDKAGVRLPQVYRNVVDSNWMEIVGVNAATPVPGSAFEGEDVKAAVKLAELIEQQEFARLIRTIDVTNFRGRKNPRQEHIFLLARNRTEPITWGPAIGEEFEGSSWREKVRLISLLLKNGAPHVEADVSCYPDRVIMKTGSTVQTADGSQARAE